ncbi:MAG: hypothetical protein KGL39_16945 [Patescibacteria group bacterium]|nr:hypothetical protein [Patescibacteria group bacterium]
MGSVNIQATISSPIAKGTASPLQLSSPKTIQGTQGQKYLGQQISQQLSTDLQNIASQVNSLNLKLQTPPSMSQLLLTNSAGQVVAAIGNMTYQGVPYTNYLSEIHVGNPLNTHNPAQALFNANLDGSVTIGQNGWLDVHDAFSGNAAWIGTQNDTLPITGAYNNGSGLIRLTVNNHTLAAGNQPTVRNMQFAGVPNATGQWTVTVIDGNTIDLQGSVWAGAFSLPDNPGGINTAAPMIDRILQVTGCIETPGGTTIRLSFAIATNYESGTAVSVGAVGGVPNATGQWIISIPVALSVTGAVDNGSGAIRLTVPGHNFQTGDKPQVLNVGGVPNADGFWTITVIDSSHVDLQGSFFTGTYTSGGTITFLHANVVDLVESPYTGNPSVFAGAYTGGGMCLQYFAGGLFQTVAVGPSFANYKLRAFPSGDLRINNASIQLTSSVGQIILDPTTTQIQLTNFSNLSEIVFDATVPSLTFYDQVGTPAVTLEILQEAALAVTSVSVASPAVLTVPGNTYVDGDTVLVQGATVNKNLLGYRIVENVNTGAFSFTLTDLAGNPINTSAPETGVVTTARYYAGLLSQSLAIGSSWSAYRLRFFADGTLKINRASIDSSTITNGTLANTSLTSVGGTAPNQLTLTINNGLLTIAGTGTAAGTGNITIDGLMTAATVNSTGYESGAAVGQTLTENVLTSSSTGTFLESISVSTSTLSYTPGSSTLTVVTGVSQTTGSALTSAGATAATYTAGLRTA